jgi:Concanavalin A-like lectin/glucanases superfamily/FecR protein
VSLSFPSREFDDVVAAVCHGSATEEEMRALNALLRREPSTRDEYLLRVELHTRLASDPALFPQPTEASGNIYAAEVSPSQRLNHISSGPQPQPRKRKRTLVLALAACLALLIGGLGMLWLKRSASRRGATSSAVAMLARTVDARWTGNTAPPRVGCALEPGTLRLQSGLAQVVFYSGARVVIEGPTELQLVSPGEAVCRTGRLLAEIPEPARGFRIKTAQLKLVDLGTAFGIEVTHRQTKVHVFKGEVEFSSGTAAKQALNEGRAALVQGSAPPRLMEASREAFAEMFDLQSRSLAAASVRYDQWRVFSARLDQDPTLLVHLDFEHLGDSDWKLRNAVENNRLMPDATIVGCQRGAGRWREKQALEFQSVNDRVRMTVPGSFDSLTLSVWVCVKGLDRQFNSLFMCDGFEPGTVHWLLRSDGVLGLTVFGSGAGKFQILASPPVLTPEQLGTWMHLAVVLNGKTKEAVHYVDGTPVARESLKLGPPFQVGSAELGNWNARTDPNPTPALIRNLSGSLDEFELFSRALSDAEVRELYSQGKPDV